MTLYLKSLPLRVKGCLHDDFASTSGAPEIAVDLLHRQKSAALGQEETLVLGELGPQRRPLVLECSAARTNPTWRRSLLERDPHGIEQSFGVVSLIASEVEQLARASPIGFVPSPVHNITPAAADAGP